MSLELPVRELPVLRDTDLVVVGGSLSGVAAALGAAGTGARVCLVESSTYLGREVTGSLRLWLSRDDVAHADAGGVLRALTGDAIPDGLDRRDEVAIWPDAAKRRLEEQLEEAGVSLLYATRPVALWPEFGSVGGVVVANKSGRQLLRAARVMLASEAAGLLRPDVRSSADCWFTVELTGSGCTLERPRLRDIGPELGLAGNQIRLHPGYREVGHVLVECRASLLRSDLGGPGGSMADRARRLGMSVYSHLTVTDPDFAGSWPAAVSYRPLVAAPEERPEPPDGVTLLDPPDGWLGLLGRPEPTTRLARLVDAAAEAGTQWDRSVASGEVEHPRRADAPERTVLEVREPEPPAHWIVPTEPAGPAPIAHVLTTDVLVVGGGSSGVSGAVAAAGEGASTVLVDANPGLGGTGTYGGVDSYWFGRRDGLATPNRRAVSAAHRALGLPGGSGKGWNIEVKADALLGLALAAGVRTITDSVVFGVIMNGDRVTGVVLASPDGIVAVKSKIIIDATGDADLAVAAGAPVRHGSDRSHASMWYSLAQFVEPGRTRNNFGGVLDMDDVVDYTRAVVAARRRGGDDLHDHGVYLAARESRNIVGETTITMRDQLVRQHFDDVINVHFSNHDIKGKSESIWTLMGLIPPNLEIEVPYRALLPREVDGLLVAGKAISVTHDGLAAVRMQSDLENLGAVAGIIAAGCAQAGATPRTLDLPPLQRRLAALGAFDPELLRRPPGPQPVSADVDDLISRALRQVPLHAYSHGSMTRVHRDGIPFVDLVLHPDPATTERVAERMAEVTGEHRMVLARVLVCRGDHRGSSAIVHELERAFGAESGLPERRSMIKHAQLPPDQAAMPDEAYLLYTLGLARDPAAIPLWQHVADRVDASPEAIRSMTAGTFAYVDAVAYGAARLGDPRSLPALQQLQNRPTLHGQHRPSGFEADVFQERQAMLELALAGARARSGDRAGVRILTIFLGDSRGPFRRQAHTELRLLFGRDLGHRPEAWLDLLEATGLAPNPLPPDADLLAPDGLGAGSAASPAVDSELAPVRET
ncbi:FAD-dependent oxidoreductase [Microlunatus parietis]|uniref:Flavin-dependent dehydrogenase n=1 Tax=Microlunatus parietis TaxID=682979 RepID=A0A7Y9LD69_9ACTN|nr:FAD-dependent oxidoreductase [Microlunatus parietis]NYE71611.1 flavin-dependent dehydrogenase [Microlunatus parietis]